jgi:hypothetical protein
MAFVCHEIPDVPLETLPLAITHLDNRLKPFFIQLPEVVEVLYCEGEKTVGMGLHTEVEKRAMGANAFSKGSVVSRPDPE